MCAVRCADTDSIMVAVVCFYCGKPLRVRQRCTRCRVAMYCEQHCQKGDWSKHKPVCNANASRSLFVTKQILGAAGAGEDIKGHQDRTERKRHEGHKKRKKRKEHDAGRTSRVPAAGALGDSGKEDTTKPGLCSSLKNQVRELRRKWEAETTPCPDFEGLYPGGARMEAQARLKWLANMQFGMHRSFDP